MYADRNNNLFRNMLHNVILFSPKVHAWSREQAPNCALQAEILAPCASNCTDAFMSALIFKKSCLPTVSATARVYGCNRYVMANG